MSTVAFYMRAIRILCTNGLFVYPPFPFPKGFKRRRLLILALFNLFYLSAFLDFIGVLSFFQPYFYNIIKSFAE